MKKMRIILPILCVALAATLFLGSKVAAKAADEENDAIADGVYIGAVDVSGMTSEEAKAAVADYVKSLNETSFTFVGADDDHTLEATAEDMGITTDIDTAVEEACAVTKSGSLIRRFKEIKDLEKEDVVVDMNLEVDKQKTANLLYSNGSKLNIEAINMGLTHQNGSFRVVDGQKGREVDYVQSVYDINDFLINDWDGSSNEIQLAVNDVEPLGSEEELAKVQDVLGTFQTTFPLTSAGRTQNVKTGCERISGNVVYPGKEFSADKAMRPYDEANGYALAGSYENGKVVESFGGGICQVSTTLYNAVIRAELEVTARYNHSMVVNYVDLSADAAIAGDWKDFKFVNNTNAPVYIEGSVVNGVITFTIYGEETRAADHKVTFESETLSTDEPETKFKMTEDQPLGYYHVDNSAHIGYKARLWKIVTEGGKEKSRDIFNNSTYKASPKEVTIGIGGATPEQVAQIQAAVDTKDEAQIQAAIAAAATPAADPNAGQGQATPQAPAVTTPPPAAQPPAADSSDGQTPPATDPDADKKPTTDDGSTTDPSVTDQTRIQTP